MRFGWGRAAVLAVAMMALAACGRGGEGGPSLEDRAAAAAYFMESNARAEGIETLPSGVQYKILASGPARGVKPDGNDLVRVDYEGTLTDGRVFDSSFERGSPAVFHLDQVVPGWTEGLRNMRVGDEWLLYIPPELGYGERGAGGMTPPNSVLVFRVKLLDVAPIPGDAPTRGAAAAAV